MNTKRKATLLGAAGAILLFLLVIIGPAIGGQITCEQPTTAFAAK